MLPMPEVIVACILISTWCDQQGLAVRERPTVDHLPVEVNRHGSWRRRRAARALIGGCPNTHPPSNKVGRRIDSVPAIQSTARLAGGHCFRRSHRQLQDLAQCAQIRITWPTVICLPEIDARLADTDLLGNFSDRQATLNAGVPQITRQTWFTRQASDSFSIKRKARGTYCSLLKKSTGPGNVAKSRRSNHCYLRPGTSF